MKVYLELECLKSGIELFNHTWKKGEKLQYTFDLFGKETGLAFNPLDKRWKVLKAELREYKLINNK